MKKTIKKEICELLDIRDDNNFSDLELFKLLDKKRKAIHPDRTTDKDVKEEYNKKAMLANNLYEKFGKFIKDEPTTLALQISDNEIQFEYIDLKFENDELKKQISNLNTKIEQLEIERKKTNKIIEALNDKKIEEETEKLKGLFKPKTNKLIALGITALIGILIHILTQTEQAIGIYMKYLPSVTPKIINIITLSILLIITGIFLTNYIKQIIIKNWTEKVKSTEFNTELFTYINEQPTTKRDYDTHYHIRTMNFEESSIYNFIKKYFESENKYVKLFRKAIGLNVYSVYENFKKIIIFQLINKDIIKINGNSGFDKKFKLQK
ncbi:hypothetical protein [Tenacibaculum finnmarkense]|uniref:hypothetical protein n=1 Tax=Tenacibaculum finnmarkense TaxID=2781243 RepID=UPI00187B3F15|nr:hypothetical protein [Tenacibaculum finnmarkense]MBE7661229.1 hypothetical protein [Tenacibaculum finnmarkense genomovar finnmarkense]MCG8253208.1 hypothetical protein [Tenacibaculum finnmarkense genomovar finnmarkense]MCG8731625.1 coiled-coil domain-containing protein 22 [Tenacibaculum finnmarkense]MCG8773135.1 coiled-coil domain-containing protein 22 [Tenacibaculum finnmarkense]MCG8816709.1 coiled-coil domain-containing protein 22 [Tenacibaculum finnmarkense]